MGGGIFFHSASKLIWAFWKETTRQKNTLINVTNKSAHSGLGNIHVHKKQRLILPSQYSKLRIFSLFTLLFTTLSLPESFHLNLKCLPHFFAHETQQVLVVCDHTTTKLKSSKIEWDELSFKRMTIFVLQSMIYKVRIYTILWRLHVI